MKQKRVSKDDLSDSVQNFKPSAATLKKLKFKSSRSLPTEDSVAQRRRDSNRRLALLFRSSRTLKSSQKSEASRTPKAGLDRRSSKRRQASPLKMRGSDNSRARWQGQKNGGAKLVLNRKTHGETRKRTSKAINAFVRDPPLARNTLLNQRDLQSSRALAAEVTTVKTNRKLELKQVNRNNLPNVIDVKTEILSDQDRNGFAAFHDDQVKSRDDGNLKHNPSLEEALLRTEKQLTVLEESTEVITYLRQLIDGQSDQYFRAQEQNRELVEKNRKLAEKNRSANEKLILLTEEGDAMQKQIRDLQTSLSKTKRAHQRSEEGRALYKRAAQSYQNERSLRRLCEETLFDIDDMVNNRFSRSYVSKVAASKIGVYLKAAGKSSKELPGLTVSDDSNSTEDTPDSLAPSTDHAHLYGLKIET